MTTSRLTIKQARVAHLSTLSKLTMIALVGYVALMSYAMAIMAGRLDRHGAIAVGVALLLAATIASGRRWAPLIGAVVSGVLVVEVTPGVAFALRHATSTEAVIFHALLIAAPLLGLAAGSVAAVQNYGGRARRVLQIGLVALAVLMAVGVATILAILPRSSAADHAEATVTLPTLATANFAFDQTEIRVKVGERVALPLTNRDPFAHSFDVDEWGVHQLMLTGEPSIARFTPTEPGTYTFYCGIPGHRQNGMTGTLIVEQ